MVYPLVIKHGCLENPRAEWRFRARNIIYFCGPFFSTPCLMTVRVGYIDSIDTSQPLRWLQLDLSPVQEPNQTWYINSYGLLVSLWHPAVGKTFPEAQLLTMCWFSKHFQHVSALLIQTAVFQQHVETRGRPAAEVVIQCPMLQNIYISIASLVPWAAPSSVGIGWFFHVALLAPFNRDVVEECMIWICLTVGYLPICLVVTKSFPL